MSRLSVADEARTSIKSSGGKGVTISLQIADIEQTRNELMEAGVTPTPIKDVWGAKAIYVYDPEGIDLSFGQNGQRSSHVQMSYSMKLENEESAMLGMLTSHLAQR